MKFLRRNFLIERRVLERYSVILLLFFINLNCFSADTLVDIGTFLEKGSESRSPSKKIETIEFENKEIVVNAREDESKGLFTFKFLNQHNLPLRIISVETSCGCTVVDYRKDYVEPNHGSTITAEFSFGTSSGKLTKHITAKFVNQDSTQEYSYQLYLVANVGAIFNTPSSAISWHAESFSDSSAMNIKKINLPFISAGDKKVLDLKLPQSECFSAVMERNDQGCSLTISPKPDSQTLSSSKTTCGYFDIDVQYPNGNVRSHRVWCMIIPKQIQ